MKSSNSIQADVIVLGCSLPGIVIAHKLKRKLGNTVDVVILDLASPKRQKISPKGNVGFLDDVAKESQLDLADEQTSSVKQITDYKSKNYIAQYASEFKIPVPDGIANPEKVKSPLLKLFQYKNGSSVPCPDNYHDFEYLSLLEKFEINQYQTLLDQQMRDLFQSQTVDFTSETKILLSFDRTSMEKHIQGALLFSTSREIMRTAVRLICGAPADQVSVLFYLHQCYRCNGSRHHLDGNNVKLREKLYGYCKKQLAHKMYQSIADITLPTNSIKEIRTYSDEQVILETMKGEKNYICNLLAMAVKPDQLNEIQVEDQLLPENITNILRAMTPGLVKKFIATYENNFWGDAGFSGDILSIRGPIVWATERPKFSATGSEERYSSLTGFILTKECTESDSKSLVLEQLVSLFGEQAASPITYREWIMKDIYVPRCGDYVGLKRCTRDATTKFLVWSALDIFGDGDIGAALEAGHTAYVHLMSCLRPQAQTYDDLSAGEWPTYLSEDPFTRWYATVNYFTGVRWTLFTLTILMGIKFLRTLRQ